ncbi:hypothetical protein RRF57_006157 [Xylaria bambusicola]|uniref:Uncharacterized protein n=1 Tax=Xylaria bambusicola TaxID=326684 RepID=A0AAN7Z6L3_9PEZI
MTKRDKRRGNGQETEAWCTRTNMVVKPMRKKGSPNAAVQHQRHADQEKPLIATGPREEPWNQ